MNVKNKERKKERLVRSISDQFKRTIKITALTVGLVAPVVLFANGSGCDTDDDCIIIIGNPPPELPPGYEGPTPGCDYLWDSDCDDDSGGGGSGGGGSGSGNSQQCQALEARKPPACHSDPLVNASSGQPLPFVSYGTWLISQFSSINPRVYERDFQGQLVQVRQYRNLTSNMSLIIGHQMSISYMSSGTYINSRSTIWNTLAAHCQQNFFQTDDRNDCLQEQADFMASLHPNPSQGGGSWGGSVSWGPFSASIGGTTPTGNWVSNFLDKVQADKQCNLWFEDPAQDDCNGGN